MQFAGYYFYKRLDAYDINYERVKRVMNACDAAESFARKWNRFETYGRINAFRIRHYQKKMEQYSRKFQRIAHDEDSTAFRVEPANGERFRFVNQLLDKFLLIAVFLCFTVLIAHVGNLNPGESVTADQANVSFWSSLLGACIPGICTILTTYLLIHHEYRVDYHKERMSSLPMFSLIHVANKGRYINETGEWDENRNPLELFDNTAEDDIISGEEVDLYILRNQGSGNAFNVSHDRGDVEFNFGDIPSKEEKVVALRKYASLYYVISFMDIYGNKYTQRFDVDAESGRYNITSFPPELVFRTKLIRYQQ